VENLLLEDDLISQVMVYGDRKKYLSALVVPDYRKLKKMVSGPGLEGLPPEVLAGRQEVHDLLMDRIAERTTGLARYESVKRIVVLPQPFTLEKGELTPDLKIRREAVTDHYRDRLEALYGDV
jgi:long-chain acyl-CoA synthetase